MKKRLFKSEIEKRLESELDFDFHLDTVRINTMEEFCENLLQPFEEKKQIFYRGERKNSLSRPLLPSLYRNKEFLFQSSNRVSLVDSDFLCRFYKGMGEYYEMYRSIIED